MGRLNRSSCRSYIMVRSDHQRSGVIFFSAAHSFFENTLRYSLRQAQGPQRDVVDRRKGRFPTDRNAEAPSYTFSPLEGASIEGDTSGLFCQSAAAIAQAILE